MNKVFVSCDKLREDVLPQLGVKLEDRFNQPTIWKLYEKEELLKEMETEKKEKEEKKQSNPKNVASNSNNKVYIY